MVEAAEDEEATGDAGEDTPLSRWRYSRSQVSRGWQASVTKTWASSSSIESTYETTNGCLFNQINEVEKVPLKNE